MTSIVQRTVEWRDNGDGERGEGRRGGRRKGKEESEKEGEGREKDGEMAMISPHTLAALRRCSEACESSSCCSVKFS